MKRNAEILVTETPCNLPKIGWSPIIAGAFIGVGLGFLLQLYSIAIGLSAFNSSPTGTATIAVGGLLGLLVGVIASMGIAGFVSGYLGRLYYCYCHGGIIYGFLTWSLALFLTAVMILPLTHYTTTYTKTLAPTVTVTNTTNDVDLVTTDNTATSKKGDKITQAQVKVTPNTLTGSSWMVFILFFIGALSSCIGACCGMNCKKNHVNVPPVV